MACLLHKGNRWRGFVSLNAWLMVVWTHNWELLVKQSAAAAASLQSCPTLCDPIDGSPPGSLSLGFSRQEHWSGLPFPSPMHESEKWKGSCSVVSDSLRPHGLQPTRLLRPWDFPGKSTGVGCHCLLLQRPYKLLKSQLKVNSNNNNYLLLEWSLDCIYWKVTIALAVWL